MTALVSTPIGNPTWSFSQWRTTVTEVSVGLENRYSRLSSNSVWAGVAVSRTASSFSS